MARPPGYDQTQLIEKVLEVFWRKGYAQTSIDDLVSETGASRHSLYKSFGDKDTLYQHAIEHYTAEIIDPMMDPLRTEGASRDAVVGVITSFVYLIGGQGSRGCFLCNAASSVQSGDVKTSRAISAYFELIRETMIAPIDLAQQRGEVAGIMRPAALASMILAGIVGSAVMLRAGASQATMHQQIESMLALLSPPNGASGTDK